MTWRPASTITEPGWYWMLAHPDREPVPVRVWTHPSGYGYGYDCGCRMGRLPETAWFAGPLTPPEDTTR